MEQKTYKCTLCGKEIPAEEAEVKVSLDFPDHGITVCAECAEKALRDNIAKAAATLNLEQVNQKFVGENGKPLNPASIMRTEAVKSKVQDMQLDHLRKIVSANTPSKIKAHLDQYIIGQEDAKRTLSVAVYNHYKRILYKEMSEERKRRGESIPDALPSTMKKSNIIMLGPSGTGKTAILKALSEYLDVPFAITDASALTEAGYVGQDPETCVKNLYIAAGKDVKKTECGIVFLDEFDKISRKSGTNRSTTADPGHEGIQQALLKIIEGTVVNFNPDTRRRNPDAQGVYVDTSNILFICGGAFEGIEDIISNRVDENNGFGFGKEDSLGLEDEKDEAKRYNKLIDHIKTDDIKEYGILPEMLGRLPIICKLHQLSEEDLVRILTEPKDAILKQFAQLFRFDGCSLKFEHEALTEIAKKAIETKTGARSLRTIVENMLLDTMYDLPDMSAGGKHPVITVTKESVESKEFAVDYKTAA